MEILIAGDFHGGGKQSRVRSFIEQEDYKSLFEQVKQITDCVDYSIVNFESPIVNGDAEPIKKTGPNLQSIDKAMDAVVYAGFNCVTLANNHFFDYGEKGVNDTIAVCREKCVDFVGGGKNLEQARKILYKEIKGKKIAFVNFCENEWSIATDITGGSAPLDVVNNYYDISEAKKQSDYVIVIVHGGKEHYQLPTPRMQKDYRFFVDAGADVVINHHQHCYSGYEQYNDKYIFYGLGNFCFESTLRNSIWNEGYMLKLKFEDIISFELIPYVQCDDKAGVFLMQGDKGKKFFDNIDALNLIISDKLKLENHYANVVNKDKNMLNYLEPYNNRYLFSLRIRGLLPSFLNAKKKRLILNLFRCETHRDVLFRLLNNSKNG